MKYNIEEGKTHYIFYSKEQRDIFDQVASPLFRSNPVKIIECTERVIYVEDEDEQIIIIHGYHQGKTCHRGVKETLARIKRNYYWPNMDQTVATEFIPIIFKKIKYDRNPIKPQLQLTQTQSKPF